MGNRQSYVFRFELPSGRRLRTAYKLQRLELEEPELPVRRFGEACNLQNHTTSAVATDFPDLNRLRPIPTIASDKEAHQYQARIPSICEYDRNR